MRLHMKQHTNPDYARTNYINTHLFVRYSKRIFFVSLVLFYGFFIGGFLGFHRVFSILAMMLPLMLGAIFFRKEYHGLLRELDQHKCIEKQLRLRRTELHELLNERNMEISLLKEKNQKERTRRKQAEDKLHQVMHRDQQDQSDSEFESKSTEQNIFNSELDSLMCAQDKNIGMLLCHFSGHVFLANDTICQWLLCPKEDIRTQRIYDFIPSDVSSLFSNKINELRQEGGFSMKAVFQTKRNTMIPVEVNASVIEYLGIPLLQFKVVLTVSPHASDRIDSELSRYMVMPIFNTTHDVVYS